MNAASAKSLSLDELLAAHGAMALHFGPAAYGAVVSATKAKPNAASTQESAAAYIERLRGLVVGLEQDYGHLMGLARLLLDVVEEAYTTSTPIDPHAHDDGPCAVCELELLLAGDHPDDDLPAGGAVPPAAETTGGTA